MGRLSIRSWFDPFPHHEGVAVVFDIFRCSTTIHTLMSRSLGSVIVAPSLKEVTQEKRISGMRVFSELSQPVECLERFDNSPHHALVKPWKEGRAALVATTTGTPAMFAARPFEKVFVGSLVNFSSLVAHLTGLNKPVTLIPAAPADALHVEDEITAQAMATALEGFANLPDFVRQCGEQAIARIKSSPRPEALSAKLATGREDVTLAMELDRFPQVLSLEFEAGEKPLFAMVKKES